jgi:hypothetical protein
MHTTEHTRGGYTACKIVYTDATTGEECEIPHVCLVQARREAAKIFDLHYSVRVVEVIFE